MQVGIKEGIIYFLQKLHKDMTYEEADKKCRETEFDRRDLTRTRPKKPDASKKIYE